MVPQNVAVLAKLSFCSECSQNFCGCLFARARTFLQVLACSVFSGVAFWKVLIARKANFCQYSCSQRKTLCSHARKDHLIPFTLNALDSRLRVHTLQGKFQYNPHNTWNKRLFEVYSRCNSFFNWSCQDKQSQRDCKNKGTTVVTNEKKKR